MFSQQSNQISFSGIELDKINKSKTAQFLKEVSDLINWKEIENILKPLYCQDNGRPAFPAMILFKGILLQQWYQLSDFKLEEELKDRISFRLFVGLESPILPPDETTIVRFRKKLGENNLQEKLFNIINNQLRRKRKEIKKGKCLITDASIIESPYGKEPKGNDGNGDFIIKNEEIKKGYKTHIVINKDNGLVESAILTVASCHESAFLERVLNKVSGKILGVLGDKGYFSDQRKKEFREKGIYHGILEKRKNNQKFLTKKQKIKNKRLSKIRSSIERVFAVVKEHYGWRRVKYFGLKKNRDHMFSIFSAFNIQLFALKQMRAR